MPSLIISSEPVFEPVTLDEIKDNLRITATDEDDFLVRAIKSARWHTEQDIRQTIPQTTYKYYLDAFPVSDIMTLPMGPVISITSVKYYDSNNTQQTWSSDNYYTALTSWIARIQYTNSWPTTYEKINAVEIEYVAGYADRNDIPENLKQAVILLASHYYENRQAVNVVMGSLNTEVLPFGYEALVAPFRVYNESKYAGR